MKKIDKDSYEKAMTQTYTRIYRKSDLEKEQEVLVKRLAEINAMLDDMKKAK